MRSAKRGQVRAYFLARRVRHQSPTTINGNKYLSIVDLDMRLNDKMSRYIEKLVFFLRKHQC